MTAAPAISLRRLTLRDHLGRPLVTDLDLEIAPGQAAVLTAPPEVGNAVLRAVVGLWPAQEGEARVLGEEVRSLPRARAEALLARVGYVPRYGALVSNLSLRENLVLPLRWHRHLGEPEARHEAARAAARFGVDELPAVIPPLASVELRRRVALARAVVLSPEVLVLDDPTEDLDPATATEVAGQLAAAVRALGAAVLATSHEDLVAGALSANTFTLDVPSTP